ncbi:MAG: MFS transporter [Paenirhodobacter sp.]|uniref:MFS transporter n=1 Tax=Paenirhodobacter sp. TaxID=1965326 RepID=UPI003D0EFC42
MSIPSLATLASPFRPILRDPALMLAAVLITLFGLHAATLAPYVSTLAVTVFHLSDGAFSAILVLASLIAVSSSVGFGILADQRANRRAIALATGVALTLGTGLVTLAPRTPSFVIAHALLLPISGSFFGQLFALARLAATTHPERDRPAILSTLRALFALAWVVALPIWSVAFRAGVPLTAVYPVCLIAAVAILALIWAFWPRDGATRWPDPRSGLSFRAALREIAEPAVLIRVLALGTINGAVMLYLIVIGLVFATIPGRGAEDTALYAGLMAGLEVPFMLALPAVLHRLPRTGFIWLGMALYAVHLAGLPLLAATPWVWILTLFGAVGGAVVLTQPMAYLQDLLGARPGAGASLMALQKLAGDVICAGTFAIGTALSGYALTAVIGATLGLIGGGMLWALDRRR